MNIFKEILKELPESKIEGVPDDPKDQEVANQMTQLIRHASMGVKFNHEVCCGKKWDEQNENE